MRDNFADFIVLEAKLKDGRDKAAASVLGADEVGDEGRFEPAGDGVNVAPPPRGPDMFED